MTSARIGLSLSAAALILVPLVIAIGQILFKVAAQTPGLLHGSRWISLASNPVFIAALMIYAAATVWWVVVLRSTSLSHAYAFMGLSFVYVPVLSWLLLGERFGWRTGVAFALILLGIGFATSDQAVAASAPPDSVAQ
jgi:drug/metabolite transporter (DMT)-like permease